MTEKRVVRLDTCPVCDGREVHHEECPERDVKREFPSLAEALTERGDRVRYAGWPGRNRGRVTS